MIEIGKGGQRSVKTVMMSRYACYLVIQNADPSKEIVAHGQTYFAIQTRRQELGDEELETERRLAIRSKLKKHNSQLADAAKDAGVLEPKDHAIFQNHGTELAANLFRATQAEDKLRREKITGKDKANGAHREVGAKVRQTIQELGGTMPEELPPAESIKKLESKVRKGLKNDGGKDP